MAVDSCSEGKSHCVDKYGHVRMLTPPGWPTSICLWATLTELSGWLIMIQRKLKGRWGGVTKGSWREIVVTGYDLYKCVTLPKNKMC